MTTKGELRNLVATTLDGATDAGPEVYTPSDWPTHDGEYPVILVSAPREEKESTGGRGTTEFTVTATIRVVAKVELAAFAADYGAELAEAAIEGLQQQIEALVINNPAINAVTSQYAFVRSQIGVSAEGEQHYAELMMEIGLEFYQGPDDFFDNEGVALTVVTITPTPGVLDPSGIVDGALYITLPQE